MSFLIATTGKLSRFFRYSMRSRLAWLVAALHAAWFFIAIAGMGSPSSRLGAFLEQLAGSDTTLFAGRPFHFTYMSFILKTLFIFDIPAMIVEIPIAIIVVTALRPLHLSLYTGSYIDASMMLILATCQWLLIGGLLHSRLESSPGAQRFLSKIDRYFVFAMAIIILSAAILVLTAHAKSLAADSQNLATSSSLVDLPWEV